MGGSTVNRTVRRFAWDNASSYTIVGKINNNDTRYLSLDADNTSLAVVADTGTTSNFVEMNAPCVKNIQVADPGIKVLCPDGKNLTSTYTADLTYD